MNTYGNTGNEGQRGNDEAYNGGTFGTQGNEPSQHRDDSRRDDDSASTRQNQNGSGLNAHGSYPSNGGYSMGQGSGARGNQPSRHDDADNQNTYSTYGNEPPRHREIALYVKANTGDSISMKASMDWTLKQLHNNSARKCDVDRKQCHSACAGITLGGTRKVHETRIQGGHTVSVDFRVRGG